MEMFVPTERLVRTPDGRIIPEDELDGSAELVAVPGRAIPMSEAQALGLVNDEVKPKRRNRKVEE